MTDYDFQQICRLLQRSDVEISNHLVDLENTYQMFHRFDELDLLDLLSLKIKQQYIKEFEQDLLALCYFLLNYNQECDVNVFRNTQLPASRKAEKNNPEF